MDLIQEYRAGQQQLVQLNTRTLAEKQADNKYACSHCPNTFKKKADRKKHFQDRCTRLGDGSICPSCTHVGRNAHQVRLHRSKHRHPEPIERIALSQKRAFTCSDDGRIYYDAKTFFHHFESLDCALNHYSGTHHHQARVITLLQEGRYAEHDHQNTINLHAVLQRCCTANGISQHGWKALIRTLPDEIALAYADRLEWGQCLDRASPLSRLGYISKTKMVADILKTAAEHYKAARNLQPSSERSQVPQASLHDKPLPPFLPSNLDLGPDIAGEDLATMYFSSSKDSGVDDKARTIASDIEIQTTMKEHDLPLRFLGRTEDYSPAVAEVRRMLAPKATQNGATHDRGSDDLINQAPGTPIPALQSPPIRRTLVRRKRPPSLASDPHPDAMARYLMHANDRSLDIAVDAEPAIAKSNQPGSSSSSKGYDDDFFDFTKYCNAQKPPDQASYFENLTALPSTQASPKSPSRARAFFQHIFTSPKDAHIGEPCPITVQVDERLSRDMKAEKWTDQCTDHKKMKRQGGEWSRYNLEGGNFFLKPINQH